jgi:hypothetical protein
MPIHYRISVRGLAGPTLLGVLEGFDLREQDGDEAHLEGTLPDEAALHCALQRLQDVRVDLLRVERLSDS